MGAAVTPRHRPVRPRGRRLRPRPRRMSTEAALYRLLAWLSPAYPVGAFSYSATAWNGRSRRAWCATAPALEAWLGTVLRHGGGWTDAVLLSTPIARRRPRTTTPPGASCAPRPGLAPTRRAGAETRAQGEAFARASLAALARRRRPPAGPARRRPRPDLPARRRRRRRRPRRALGAARSPAYLQAFAANLVSAARPRSSRWARPTASAPSPRSSRSCAEAAAAPLAARSTTSAPPTLMVDLCSMRHETQYTRLFRS